MKSTKDFLERLVNDEGFAKKFEGVKDLEDLKKVAGGEGYDINLEEYKKIHAEAAELSDEKLSSASGGVNWKKFASKISGGMQKVFGTLARGIGGIRGTKEATEEIAGLVSHFKK